MPKTHEVFEKGQWRFTGTYRECFAYILNHQPQSVSWATSYGDWKIKEIPKEKTNEEI